MFQNDLFPNLHPLARSLLPLLCRSRSILQATRSSSGSRCTSFQSAFILIMQQSSIQRLFSGCSVAHIGLPLTRAAPTVRAGRLRSICFHTAIQRPRGGPVRPEIQLRGQRTHSRASVTKPGVYALKGRRRATGQG